MRILLDTNVLLDFLLAREPFAREAREIWLACEQGQCAGYLAAISVTNIWYIGRRIVGTETARQHVADLLQVLQVCAVDINVLTAACDSEIADFEDAVQVAAAIATGLDAIVTRNGAHFVNAPLPILSPTEFLGQLAAELPSQESPIEKPTQDEAQDRWDVEL